MNLFFKAQIGLWAHLRRKGNSCSTARVYVQLNMLLCESVIIFPLYFYFVGSLNLSDEVFVGILLLIAYLVDELNSKTIKAKKLLSVVDFNSEEANTYIRVYNYSIVGFILTASFVYYFGYSYVF